MQEDVLVVLEQKIIAVSIDIDKICSENVPVIMVGSTVSDNVQSEVLSKEVWPGGVSVLP